jgi:hypothetical protein
MDKLRLEIDKAIKGRAKSPGNNQIRIIAQDKSPVKKIVS